MQKFNHPIFHQICVSLNNLEVIFVIYRHFALSHIGYSDLAMRELLAVRLNRFKMYLSNIC